MNEMNAGMTVSDIIEDVIEDMCYQYCRFSKEAEERYHEAETKANDKDELNAMMDAIEDEFKAHCEGCPLHRL